MESIDYENRIAKLREILKNLDKYDRANKINILSLILTILRSEIHMWCNWILDPRVQLSITDEDLKNLINIFGNFLIKINELNIEYTRKGIENRVYKEEDLKRIIEFAKSYGYSYEYFQQFTKEKNVEERKVVKEFDKLYV